MGSPWLSRRTWANRSHSGRTRTIFQFWGRKVCSGFRGGKRRSVSTAVCGPSSGPCGRTRALAPAPSPGGHTLRRASSSSSQPAVTVGPRTSPRSDTWLRLPAPHFRMLTVMRVRLDHPGHHPSHSLSYSCTCTVASG